MELTLSSVALTTVLLILLYLGVRLLTTGSLTKQTAADMNQDVPPVLQISSPRSSVYTYSMWVYVNTWTTGIKTFFKAGDDVTLTLDSVTPTLRCTFGKNPAQDVMITDNFPISKWVYITIAVNVNVVDCYMNGKLVRTQQLAPVPPQPSFTSITFGKFDCNLVGFNREPAYLDPDTIHNNYLKGNKVSSTGPLLKIPSYGLQVGITKDGVADGSVTLW